MSEVDNAILSYAAGQIFFVLLMMLNFKFNEWKQKKTATWDAKRFTIKQEVLSKWKQARGIK